MDILEKVEQTRREIAKTFADNPYLIIHVDMDKTLTMETCWTIEECYNVKPNIQMVKAVNTIAQRDVVIIYTARQNHLIPATIDWLNKYNVRYDAISNIKRPTCLYIDDKSFNPFDMRNCILKNKSHKAWQKG